MARRTARERIAPSRIRRLTRGGEADVQLASAARASVKEQNAGLLQTAAQQTARAVFSGKSEIRILIQSSEMAI